MANLGCQFGYTSNELKPNQQGMPACVCGGGSRLDHLRAEDLSYVWVTPGGSLYRQMWQKEAFAFHLPALTVPAKSIYPTGEAALHWQWTYLFRTQHSQRPAETANLGD